MSAPAQSGEAANGWHERWVALCKRAGESVLALDDTTEWGNETLRQMGEVESEISAIRPERPDEFTRGGADWDAWEKLNADYRRIRQELEDAETLCEKQRNALLAIEAFVAIARADADEETPR